MAQKQNYLTKLEQNKKKRLASRLVSAKYPNISGIVINITYYHNVSDQILMHRTINVTPQDHAYFNIECMTKDCMDGGFELGSVISGLIKNHKRVARGRLICKGKGNSLGPEHASVSYEVHIKY